MTTPPTTRRPVHHSVMAILFPPLAHWHHGRYHGRPHHFVLDSGLNLFMLGLALWVGVGVWFMLQSSGLGIVAHVPSVINNQATTLVIDVHNRMPTSVQNVVAKVGVPAGWELQTSADELRVSSLAGGAIHSWTISILPHGQARHTYTLRFLVQGERDGILVSQTATISVRLQPMPMTLQTTGTSGVIGQTMSVNLQVSSTSDEVLDAVMIQPRFPASLPVRSVRPALTNGAWTFAHLAARSNQSFQLNVRPGRSGTIQLPIAIGVLRNGKFIVDRLEQVTLTIRTASTPQSLITSAPQQGANISSEAVYFSAVGFQFGYGQIPLRVQKETTVRIFWHIRPSTTRATAVTVNATLPSYIQWQSNSSVTAGSQMTYDAGQRRVRWAIGAWNPSGEVMTGSFDVRITPSTAQLGTYPVLVSGARLTYLDAEGRTQTAVSGFATTKTIDPQNSTAGKVKK